MKYRVNRSVTIDYDMMAEIETRMKDEGITFCELMRRAASLYLTNGEQPDSIDSEHSEQIEHKPDSEHKPSLSDMLNDSDFS